MEARSLITRAEEYTSNQAPWEILEVGICLAITSRAAQYITEEPAAATFIKRLFNKEKDKPKFRLLMRYGETSLAILIIAQNPFAIGPLFELMDESKPRGTN